ncbi:hypothetical protein BH18THE1_BH18THE1_03050 [soil metagenome]
MNEQILQDEISESQKALDGPINDTILPHSFTHLYP